MSAPGRSHQQHIRASWPWLSVHQGRCDGVTGYPEQKWEWPGVAGIRNTSDHVLSHQHYACVQNYLVARGSVTGAASEDFCPLFPSQAILQVCDLLGQEAETGEAEGAKPPPHHPASAQQPWIRQKQSRRSPNAGADVSHCFAVTAVPPGPMARPQGRGPCCWLPPGSCWKGCTGGLQVGSRGSVRGNERVCSKVRSQRLLKERSYEHQWGWHKLAWLRKPLRRRAEGPIPSCKETKELCFKAFYLISLIQTFRFSPIYWI